MNVISKGIVERGTVAQPTRPRFYCTENEWDCPGACEGEHTHTKPVGVSDIGPALAEARLDLEWSATVAVNGEAILVDVADPTGPNGQRSFIVEFNVREV